MSEKIVMLNREGESRSMGKGFCWPAFIVPTLWALSEGLWRQSALSMLAAVAARAAFQAARADGVSLLSVAGLLIYPSIMFVFGRFGNRWLLSHLMTRGWMSSPHAYSSSDRSSPR
jgi:hypothetical protein